MNVDSPGSPPSLPPSPPSPSFDLLKTEASCVWLYCFNFHPVWHWKQVLTLSLENWLKKWFRLSSRKLTVLVWSLVREQCLMSCVTNKNELNYEWNDRKIKKSTWHMWISPWFCYIYIYFYNRSNDYIQVSHPLFDRLSVYTCTLVLKDKTKQRNTILS